MTRDEIRAYAGAVLAHIEAQRALRLNDLDAARAAYCLREEALDLIEGIGRHLRTEAFARVLVMAREATERQGWTA